MTEIPNNNNKGSADDQNLDKTKQIVDRLFKIMNENQVIPASAKDVINKLSSRFMEIALATPNLFVFENHQARIFFNNVCRTSIQWTEIEDGRNTYLKKLETIVDRINEQVQYNNKDFIQYQNDLEKCLVKLKKRAAIKQKRKNEKLLGQQIIAQAKDETAKIISHKLAASAKVPEYIEHILRDEWTNVLVLLHIRNGPESEIYKSNLEFVNLLLEIVLMHESIEGHKQEYRSLFKKHQKGLTLVAFNKQEIKDKGVELLRYLKTINQPQKLNDTMSPEDLIKLSQHQQNTSEQVLKVVKADEITPEPEPEDNNDQPVSTEVIEPIEPTEVIEAIEATELTETIEIKGTTVNENESNQSIENNLEGLLDQTNDTIRNPKPNETHTQYVEKPEVNNLIQPLSQEVSSEDNVNYAEIISSLKQGTWFELIQADGKIIKAKLSWVSPISGNFLFVDLHGLKIGNKSKSELTEGLKNNSFKIINAN